MGITVVEMLVPTSHGALTQGGPPPEDLGLLAVEFPTVELRLVRDDGTRRETIALEPWIDRHADFAGFDAVVDGLIGRGEERILLRGPRGKVVAAAGEMLTRWQRHVGRRNAASRCPAFERVLDRLRAMDDCSKPLVLADWRHALDAWQWMLRLDPQASVAAQLAALLHDVERLELESDADARVEHLAPNYEHFKGEHPRSALMAHRLLESSAVDGEVVRRTVELVAEHERPGRDPERGLMNDADALSFFSQNSAAYLDYFGPAKTARKVAYTLRRMSRGGRSRLGTFRVRADVARLLGRVREGLCA